MSRLSRRNRTNSDCGIKTSGWITDLIDNTFKSMWYITDQEYDMILNKMTDDEMSLFFDRKTYIYRKKKNDNFS
jgi:hypothetical protein